MIIMMIPKIKLDTMMKTMVEVDTMMILTIMFRVESALPGSFITSPCRGSLDTDSASRSVFIPISYFLFHVKHCLILVAG